MLAQKFPARLWLLLVATACIALIASRAEVVRAQSGGASITTDRSQYRVGDTATICYSVPAPGSVVVTDISANGNTVLLSGQDDGTGGCASGTISPPTGKECERLDYQGSRSQSVQTCFQVVNASSGGSASQSSGFPCADPSNNCTNCGQVVYAGQVGNPCNPVQGGGGPCADPSNNCGPNGSGSNSNNQNNNASSATITTDRSQYQVGDTATICYTVPAPGSVVVTDISANGNTVLLSGQDDGSGGCSSGTITPPTGKECERLDYQGSRSQSVQTCFQVVNSSSGGTGTLPSGFPCADPSGNCNSNNNNQNNNPAQGCGSGQGASVSVQPASAPVGGTVTVSGQCFTANGQGGFVQFTLLSPDGSRVNFGIANGPCTQTPDGNINCASAAGGSVFNSNADGTFLFQLTVPYLAQLGAQQLCVQSIFTGDVCTAFTVQG